MEKETNVKSNPAKGIKITNICICIVVAGIIILALIMSSLNSISSKYQGLIEAADTRQRIEEDMLKLENGRDYLDARAKEAVVQTTAMKMKDYSKEYTETMRVQNAVDDIKMSVDDSDTGIQIKRYFDEAVKKQRGLIDKQLHAMKLIVVMKGLKKENIPAEIYDYELTEEELSYSPEEMYEKAFNLMYEDKYFRAQESMDKKLRYAEEKVKEYTAMVQAASKDAYEIEIRRMFILVCISSLIIVGMLLFIFLMILLPVRRFHKNIMDESPLDIVGAYEFKYLAHIYNDIFEKNKNAKLLLQHKADHDGLTGLLNRQAFNSLKELYSESTENLAVMIVDVDLFKNVNDTYGHEVGDIALKKVASLLVDNFRSCDYFIRYGGDEFVVLMTDTDESQKEVISKRVEAINSALQNPEDSRLPKLSVSVGVAFTHEGFTDDFFKRADGALYITKEKGRCGYTFG